MTKDQEILELREQLLKITQDILERIKNESTIKRAT